MDHQLWLMKPTEMINITPMVGEISWESHIDQLGQQLSFSFAYGDTRYIPQNPCQLGDLIVLKREKEIFRGVIVSNQRSERQPIQYTAMDFAFYLNKSEGVYQFNGISATQAITVILEDYNFPMGEIASMATPINGIFKDKVISEIILDILNIVKDKTGFDYRMEIREGKLCVARQNELKVEGKFRLAANLQHHDLRHSISGPSRSQSIEEMRNSIKLLYKDKPVAYETNADLIEAYGLLQYIEEIQEADVPGAGVYARDKLKELGKIFEKNSLTMLGDDTVKAGKKIEIEEPITGMTGEYLIQGCTHTLKNGVHTMALDLGVV